MNVALFGLTAREWRDANPDSKGNIRDEATLQQLIVLSNMEAMNADFIRQGLSQSDRLVRLHQSAIQMMESLIDNPSVKALPEGGDNK